jgi:hypothetical protein
MEVDAVEPEWKDTMSRLIDQELRARFPYTWDLEAAVQAIMNAIPAQQNNSIQYKMAFARAIVALRNQETKCERVLATSPPVTPVPWYDDAAEEPVQATVALQTSAPDVAWMLNGDVASVPNRILCSLSTHERILCPICCQSTGTTILQMSTTEGESLAHCCGAEFYF